MKVTYTYLESIFKSLSISYYLGRAIDAKLSKDSLDSFYSPEKDCIVISAPSIAMMLARQTFDKANVEEIVRGLLYHEVSHVILTGKNWIDAISGKNKEAKKKKKCFNIFEDERIETIFMNMYFNTNFKKNIILLNNYQGQPPRNADEAWYFLVRFHAGPQKWLDVAEFLIDKYVTVNADTETYVWRNYIDDIMKFYDDFCKEWNQNNTETAPEQDEEDAESAMDDVFGNGSDGDDGDDSDDESDSNSGKSGKSGKKNSKKNNSENDGDDSGDSGDTSDKKSKKKSNKNGSSDETDDTNDESGKEKKSGKKAKKLVTAEEAEEMAKEMRKFHAVSDEPGRGCGSSHKIIREAFQMFDDFNDAELQAKLAKIILMANKKKGYYSNSRRTYNNGRITPRNIVENDYKWFTDRGRNNNKAFAKIHFNLFIDNSGSFAKNDLKMNKFIRALNEIKSIDFDFDVITINCDIVEWPSSDAYIFKSGGGTDLNNSIAPVIKKHTLPGCQNYNIVVFDGDAHDYCSARQEPFKHFDTTNTILVVDKSNEKFLKDCNTCKKKIIENQYDKYFIDAVLELLERTLC